MLRTKLNSTYTQTSLVLGEAPSRRTKEYKKYMTDVRRRRQQSIKPNWEEYYG